MFNQFCKNSTFYGLKYITGTSGSSTHVFIRLLWISSYVFLCTITVYIVTIQYSSFMEHPTVTSPQYVNIPTTKIPFPGVSICSINKISRRKATLLAHQLSNISRQSPENVLKLLELLGYMYEYQTAKEENLLDLQRLLEKSNYLDPRGLMKWLTPRCEDLLLRCFWNNKEMNCTQHFKFQLTFEGFCCLFNYLKIRSSVDDISDLKISEQVYFQKNLGTENGLRVFIRNDIQDYFYTFVPSYGVNVHIFNGKEYPDMSTGSFSSMMVQMGTEFFVAIEPVVSHASEGIMKYSLTKRSCIFGPERGTIFGEYSEADCLVGCKAEKMRRLCKCVPFQIPLKRSLVCNLVDLPCLARHRVKWKTLAPSDIKIDLLALEEEDGLRCDLRCYPACNSVLYGYNTNPVAFTVSNESDIKQTDSIVHIFFNSDYANAFRQDEVYVWYEMIGTFGGIFSLVIGMSIISFMEVILLCIRIIWYKFCVKI